MLDRNRKFCGRSVAELRKGIFKPGATVWTSLESVSRSGTSRQLRAFVVDGGRIDDVTFLVAEITGRSTNRYGNIVMGGCGMDMGFKLVYDLSCVLYGGTRFKAAKGHREGYVLRHEWL